MRKLKILAVLLLCAVMAVPLFGCKNTKVPAGRTAITFWASPGTSGDVYYRELIDTYNNGGQGEKDGVYVNYIPKGSDYSANVGTTLMSKRAPEVMVISDQYFKNYAAQDLFVNIDELLSNDSLRTKDASGDPILDLNEIPSRLVDRFRLDTTTRKAGTGTTLYGVPNGDNPTIIYYNTAYFEAEGVNVISVAEEDLAVYNQQNGTSYMPHGYAEYTVEAKPAEGLTESTNLAGEKVVKVFNNRIAMNWEELVALSKYFTQGYNQDMKTESVYGFLNEWWFSYGWSVGGDCVGYDAEDGQYKFTLGDENPNYLVVEDVEVNGKQYKAGEILLYADKTYVADQKATGDFMSSLYELPSTYDAFAEFCALSQKKGVAVDNYGKEGYGISPSPSTLQNTSKPSYFTSGRVAMVCDEYTVVPDSLQASKLKTWDVAPLYQYREYEGGSLDAEGNLKIIGKDYGNGAYTGEIKTAGSNNTQVVGYKAASSLSSCFVIPSNAKNHESAWKFIQWAAGEEGQTIISQANNTIPNQTEYAHSEEFATRSTNAMKNILALSDAATYTDIGDWSYLEDGEWVHPWANVLNSDVRNGSMKLDEFFKTVENSTNEDLGKDKYKIVITTK